MRKLHHESLWVFVLMLCAVSSITAQSFNTLKKSPAATFDATLNTLLNNNDVSGMINYLASNPGMANNASSSKSEQGYGSKPIVHTIPLLYDAVSRILQGACPLDMGKVIIDAGCDINAVFEEKTPVYLILDYLATHPIGQCETAEKLLFFISSGKNFDVNYRYKSLLPPLAYLIRENHQYLGRFDKNYISDNVLKLLVEKGSPINTYDNDGNSLMNFAIETDNQYLSAYFIEHGIDLKRFNNQGIDALYLAIDKGQLVTVKTIISKTNFDLNINSLRNNTSVFKKYTDTYDYIADICADKAKNYNDLRAFTERFSDKFSLVKAKLDAIYAMAVSQLETAKLQAIQIISNRRNYAGKESIVQTNAAFINNFASFYDPMDKKEVSELVTQMIAVIKGLEFLEPLVNNPPGSYYTFRKNKEWESGFHKFLQLGINEDWFSYSCIENFQGWGDITAGTSAIQYVVHSNPELAETFNSTKEYMTKHQSDIADAMSKEIVSCREEAQELTKDAKAEYYARMKRYQEERCRNCEIDEDKTKFPYDDQVIYTRHNPGKIVMKNGDEYEFYINEDGEWYIQGFLSKEKFDKFGDMLYRFIEKCKQTHCR